MSIAHRAAVAALLLAASLTPFDVSAETWRMAHKMPPDSVEGRLFQSFADKVAEKTGGAIDVEVFPNEQLGKDDTVLEQLQIGTIHVYPEGGSYLQKWVPEIKWTSAPFLFDDREHWARFMQTDLAQGWMKRIEDEGGITVIGEPAAFVRGPYRVMVTEKPWSSLEEMQGIKLRLHPDELAAEAWRHLGAEVRTLPWTEVYEAIGRGIVDAVNSPVALVEPMKFYEVAPNVIRHDEYPQGMAFMTNVRVWNGLDEATRARVLEAYAEVAEESARLMAEASEKDIATMKEQNVVYSEPDVQAFVDRMRAFYEEKQATGEMPEGFLDAVDATRVKG